MKTLRENFLTVCTSCEGTGIFEEIYTTFGNEIKYRDVVCGCENGKEFDWEKVNIEVKQTHKAIEENEFTLKVMKELIEEAYFSQNKESVFMRVGKLIEAEKKAIELELYLAELDSIE
jgi:hypothetical protein